MQKLGVGSAGIDACIAARPNLATVANPLEEILTQKCIANFPKAEVWSDCRRTGCPELQVVQGALLPGIPQRLRTPAVELASNAENVAATGIPTGLDGMMAKVWWASQGPQS